MNSLVLPAGLAPGLGTPRAAGINPGVRSLIPRLGRHPGAGSLVPGLGGHPGAATTPSALLGHLVFEGASLAGDGAAPAAGATMVTGPAAGNTGGLAPLHLVGLKIVFNGASFAGHTPGVTPGTVGFAPGATTAPGTTAVPLHFLGLQVFIFDGSSLSGNTPRSVRVAPRAAAAPGTPRATTAPRAHSVLSLVFKGRGHSKQARQSNLFSTS